MIEYWNSDNETSFIWLIILLAYKGLLLIIGVFLAIETWNVKVKQLNDSQLIAVSVFVVSVVSIVSALLSYFLRKQIDLQYSLLALGEVLVGYFLLGILYISKVSQGCFRHSLHIIIGIL